MRSDQRCFLSNFACPPPPLTEDNSFKDQQASTREELSQGSRCVKRFRRWDAICLGLGVYQYLPRQELGASYYLPNLMFLGFEFTETE